MIAENIKNRIGDFYGNIGISYIDLTTEYGLSAGNCDVFPASGSIKVMVLIETFRRLEMGELSINDTYRLKRTDYINKDSSRQKTFGAIEYLHEGIELTIEDLYRLCMAVSDNSAFNILLRMYGTDSVNRTADMFGCHTTRVNRTIYDYDAISRGVENYVSVKEMATLFYSMYKGKVISGRASREMLDIMKLHQKDDIIRYYFDESLPIAHQTGYDDGIIMDMGIVFSRKPFVLAMAATGENTRNAESIMRDITLMCYRYSNG